MVRIKYRYKHTLYTTGQGATAYQRFSLKKICVRVFLYRLHLVGQLSIYKFTTLSVEEYKKIND
jgi:hypothetical protein